jgi:serine/threonine protein kinase
LATRVGLLEGRYELRGLLGCGGMADVWDGVDRRLGRRVAVKVLHPELATDTGFRARFQREARSVAALNHPAIVAVYDAGVDQRCNSRTPFIVMEHVEGQTLRAVLRERGRLPPDRALSTVGEVLDALAYSHEHGIVHRDIKPANVMVTPSGAIKVMDFGIARSVTDSSHSTGAATVIGTAHYLSPEQACGGPADARSDIYSTGCMLYELLTGRRPFRGDTPLAIAWKHVEDQPTPPSALNPDLPAAHEAMTMRALRKQPGTRFQTAAEMQAEIRAALAGSAAGTRRTPPPVAAQASAPADVHKPEPRRHAYALFSVATLAVIAMVFIAVTQLARHDGPEMAIVPPIREGTTAPSTSPAEPSRDSQGGDRGGDIRGRSEGKGAPPAPKKASKQTPNPEIRIGHAPGDRRPTAHRSTSERRPTASPLDTLRDTDTPQPTDNPQPTESPSTAEGTNESPEPSDGPEPTDSPSTTSPEPDADTGE